LARMRLEIPCGGGVTSDAIVNASAGGSCDAAKMSVSFH
jgi:hypothetical protein